MAGENSQFNLLLNIVGSVSGNLQKEIKSISNSISKTKDEAMSLSGNLSAQKEYLSNLKTQLDIEKSLSKTAEMGKAARIELNEGYKEQIRDAQKAVQSTKEQLSATKSNIGLQQKELNSKMKMFDSQQKAQKKLAIENDKALKKAFSDDFKFYAKKTDFVEKSEYKESQAVAKGIQDRMKAQQKLAAANENAFKKVHEGALKEMVQMEAHNQINATAAKLMKQTGLSANRLAQGMKRTGYSIDKAGNVLDSFGNSVKLGKDELKGIVKASRRFNMSALSGMFAMMALSRATGTFLSNAINSYKKINEEGGAFTQQTNKLSAAWEFFKYSMLEALGNSELFQNLITILVEIVNKFNSLSETQKSMMGLALILTFVFSTLGQIAFQVSLVASAFGVSMGVVVGIILAVIIGLVGIFAAVHGVRRIIDNWGKDTRKVVEGIAHVLFGLALVAAAVGIIIGSVLTAGIALVVAVIALAVIEIVKHWDQIKEGWIKMVAGLKAAFVIFKYFFIDIVTKIKSFAINSFSTLAIKAAEILEKLGMDGLASRIKTAVNALKEANDEKLANIEDAKNKELAAIIVERDAKLDAIKAEQKAREEAAKAEEKKGGIGGVFGSMMDPSALSKFTGSPDISQLTSQSQSPEINNYTNNVSPIINVNGDGMDTREVADEVMSLLNEMYSTEVGSSNGK